MFNLSQEELSEKGIVKMVVDEKPGYPCRVTLEDVEIGEEVLLFPFQHHITNSPYQSSGPIFVRKNAKSPNLSINEIPEMLLHRLLSLRVYDNKGMMIEAKTIDGEKLKNEIEVIFNNKSANYIQIHNSSPGCYNCQVNRME
ncbi:DUF1203 domain-containing protein [Polaribacter sp. MSW13]|uniref:DUF1203 domain-containing protein n=1 Tax=Polaribacter marinus TaxID=2916838 RepID=A0A9X2AJX3_9FLAO|nr:DUF1203 domain-containing protein [Polaribacter marinus]MCI2228838.1 DUF1203 domain-containing protein [Polaribacter marinus]